MGSTEGNMWSMHMAREYLTGMRAIEEDKEATHSFVIEMNKSAPINQHIEPVLFYA
jgi:hypothetical protein